MSQIYQTAADFEALFMRMFDRIATDDPDGMDPLVEQQMVIRFKLSKPDAELWVDGRTKPVQTSFGSQPLKASLTAVLRGPDVAQAAARDAPPRPCAPVSKTQSAGIQDGRFETREPPARMSGCLSRLR